VFSSKRHKDDSVMAQALRASSILFCNSLRVIFHLFVFGYDPLDAINALKHFLIDQLVKFFLPIGQSNASKYL